MKVMGITGGMGSGKSTVSKVLECMGVPVFYADDEAKNLYTQPDIKTKVISLFGNKSYMGNTPNRKFLAAAVFSNPEALQKLESILYPALDKQFKEWLKAHEGQAICAKEAAILIEKGWHKQCDYVLLVTAPKDLKIQRVQNRDGHAVKDIQARMHLQWTDFEKQKHAQFVVNNDGKELLIPQLLHILKQCKN